MVVCFNLKWKLWICPKRCMCLRNYAILTGCLNEESWENFEAHSNCWYVTQIFFWKWQVRLHAQRYAVSQLAEALRYKTEGCGFDSQRVLSNFYWPTYAVRSMAPGLTQPQTEMSTTVLPWLVKVASTLRWQPCHLHVPTENPGSFHLREFSVPI
jgi:hypothetical protein